MQQFTVNREANTPDEIWLLEHEPVYTQGLAGKAEHLLQQTHIPVIQTDRGGQITYHGPGQLMIYTLLDLNRLGLNTRDFVIALENLVIDTLATFSISATGAREAPGVYVNGAKIASIGLRVKKGCAYHGIALNVAMDLSPFSQINPCGFQGLAMTQIQNYVPDITVATAKNALQDALQKIDQLPQVTPKL